MDQLKQNTANSDSDVLEIVRSATALLRENRVVEAKRQVERALELEPNNTIIR